MTRVGLVSSEPLRPRMAGIGTRFAEFARQLSAAGFEVVLVSSADPGETAELDLPVVDVRPVTRGLGEALQDCRVAVAQGQLATAVLNQCPDLPTAIDLYDPWMVENMQYYRTLGPDLFREDHTNWNLQLSQGDFFLCSSVEQRQYYLGYLTALGRVNSERTNDDPALERLIAAVPFGVPGVLPEYRRYLPKAMSGERRLLFGALYDWYDPWPVLEALERLDRPDWHLIFINTPNPETTPQVSMSRVREWYRRRGSGWWDRRVQVIDPVFPDRRFDLLRDVDLLVSTHRPGLETDLSLRTRFLDALVVGCPIVATEGGAMSRLISEKSAGWIVPPDSVEAICQVLTEVLTAADSDERDRRCANGKELAGEFDWGLVTKPLVDFCRRAGSGKDDPGLDDRSAAIEASLPSVRRKLNKVSVAVATWDGLDHLKVCLPALAAQEDPGVEWEVLVFDNGSNDGTAEWVRENHPGVRLVRSDRNLGFALANNRLVELAEGDAVAFLNNDTRPEPSWLGELVEALGSSPVDVAAVSGLITDWEGQRLDFAQGTMRFDGHAFQVGAGRRMQDVHLPPPGAETFIACGGNALIDRRVFLEAGGFDPAYFAYFEDVDLSWRLWAGGRRICFARDAAVRHRSHATGKRLEAAHLDFLYVRNPLLTVLKNYEDGLFERMLPAILITYLWRIKETVGGFNSEGESHAEDPVVELGWGEGHNRVGLEPQAWKVALSSGDASSAPFSALVSLLGHSDEIAERRELAQACRRRSDREVFQRFPLNFVANGASEKTLFSSEWFQSLLPREIEMVRADDCEAFLGAQQEALQESAAQTSAGMVTERRPEVSVVIPTFNGARTLPDVLEALERQQDAPSFEVVVVDDGSTDEAVSALHRRRWDLDMRILSQENRGPAAARNEGVRSARGGLVAFLGDDTVPEPGWLKAHWEGHCFGDGNGKLAVLGLTRLHPGIRATPFLNWIYEEGLQFGYPLIEDPADVDFPFFYPSNLSLPRKLLLAEPFDCGFSHAAWEDIELGYRLKKSGLRIFFEQRALAFHDHPTDLRRFAERQETAGFGAVLFHERHPELAEFLGVGDASSLSIRNGSLRWWRRAGAIASEKLSLRRPELWQELLRHSYMKGVDRARSLGSSAVAEPLDGGAGQVPQPSPIESTAGSGQEGPGSPPPGSSRQSSTREIGPDRRNTTDRSERSRRFESLLLKVQAKDRTIRRLQRELEERLAWVHNLLEESASRNANALRLQEELDERSERVRRLQAILGRYASLDGKERARLVLRTEQDLENARKVRAFERSRFFRMIRAWWRLRRLLLPDESRRGRLYLWIVDRLTGAGD